MFLYTKFFNHFGVSAIIGYIQFALFGCVYVLLFLVLLKSERAQKVPATLAISAVSLAFGWFHPGLTILIFSLMASSVLFSILDSRSRFLSSWRNWKLGPVLLNHNGTLLVAAISSLIGSVIYLKFFVHSQLFNRKAPLFGHYYDTSDFEKSFSGAMEFVVDRVTESVYSIFQYSRTSVVLVRDNIDLTAVFISVFMIGLIGGLFWNRNGRIVCTAYLIFIVTFCCLGLLGIYPLATYRYFTFGLALYYVIFGIGIHLTLRVIAIFLKKLGGPLEHIIRRYSQVMTVSMGGALFLFVVSLCVKEVGVWERLSTKRGVFLSSLARETVDRPLLLSFHAHSGLLSMGLLPVDHVFYNEQNANAEKVVLRFITDNDEAAIVVAGSLQGHMYNRRAWKVVQEANGHVEGVAGYSTLSLYRLSFRDDAPLGAAAPRTGGPTR